MLSFAQAIAANFEMDPDWIISINGSDVGRYVREWEFIDDEKDQSQIKVVLANPELVNSGKYKYGQDMSIRFGFRGELSQPAQLPVAEIHEKYSTGKGSEITVTGRDESSKLSGGNNKGNHGKKDDAELLRRILASRGLQMKGDAKGEYDGGKGPLYNESDRAACYRLGNCLSHSGQDGGGGAPPESPIAGEDSSIEGESPERDLGWSFSSAAKWPGKGKAGKRDKNRADNHSGRQGQDPITAKLELKGFPSLRAKANVTMQGVGSAASGTYYVKKATHSWRPEQGYRTSAELSRGGTGQGGVGGRPPMVMYADPWEKGSMYVGHRQTDGSSQATFTYGDGSHVISFEFTVRPQKDRGGGEHKKPGKGDGIDLRKRLASYKESAEPWKSGSQGSGGSQSGSDSGSGSGQPGGSAGPGSP